MILRIMNSVAYSIDWFQTGASLNTTLPFMNFSSRVFSLSVEKMLVLYGLRQLLDVFIYML